MTPVSIVIPAFNQLEYCRQCVTSILMNTTRPHRLILVDNGSTDGVSQFFDEVPSATVIHLDSNRGFSGGVNAGIEAAEGHVLLLNSDTIVPRGWLERLECALLREPDIGIVGPMSNQVSGAQCIPGLEFANMEEIDAYADRLALERAGQWQSTERLVGFCMLIREEAVRTVGRFDESFGIGNFEDDDYCLRSRRAGYRLCMAEDSFVFHYGGRTFAGMGILGDAWNHLMDRNQQRFFEKWAATASVSPPESLQAAEVANRIALDCWKQGQTAEAVRLFKQAIEHAPEHADGYSNLGAVLWELGERERALENIQRALRRDPRHEAARENYGAAAAALGKQDEAAAFLRSLDGD